MGTLLLPSLEEKRFITMTDVSKTEAEFFIKDLENRVKTSRNLQTPKKSIDDAFQTYNLVEELDDWSANALFDELSESEVPKHRGIRAVFVDVDTATIIVGTTVVYSANYAMVGFDDDTIPDKILDLTDY